MRAAAAWSLGHFKQKKVKEILSAQLDQEKEEKVLDEIRKAIKNES
jgi:hypothetical protein